MHSVPGVEVVTSGNHTRVANAASRGERRRLAQMRESSGVKLSQESAGSAYIMVAQIAMRTRSEGF